MLSPQRVPGYPLWKSRQAKRTGRNRRRFCDKIGHGPWSFTCGSVTLNGLVVESDFGSICQRCGLYLPEKSVRMTGVA